MTRQIAAAVCILLASQVGRGQELRYVEVPFHGNFEALFRQRLRDAKDQSLPDWRQVLEQEAKKNPELSHIDWDDPKVHDALTRIMEQHSQGKLSLSDQEGIKKVLELSLPGGTSLPKDLHWPGAMPPANPISPRSDPLEQWWRDLARHTEDTGLGDWLSRSPSFQKGLQDLKTLELFKNESANWGLNGLPQSWGLSGHPAIDLGEGLFGRLANISFGDVPHFDLPSINLGRWNVPRLGAPTMGAVGWVGLGQAVLWTLVMVTALIMAWHFARYWSRATTKRSPVATLGPWPVDPSQIATRRQLIQAFDYLAILLLGGAARTWNHRAIAQRLANIHHDADATRELALLYELCRYAPGEDHLSSEEQTAARRHLRLLAGVPAS